MSKNFGCQSMVDPIKRVLIKHPREAYQTQSKVDQQAPQLNYFGTPDFEKAISDYDKFVGLLESCDIEIHFLPENDTTSLDSVYTHDPCVISNYGVILCTMGKDVCLASPTASPGKIPNLPSTTTVSGTDECQSPPWIVPRFIGAA